MIRSLRSVDEREKLGGTIPEVKTKSVDEIACEFRPRLRCDSLLEAREDAQSICDRRRKPRRLHLRHKDHQYRRSSQEAEVG